VSDLTLRRKDKEKKQLEKEKKEAKERDDRMAELRQQNQEIMTALRAAGVAKDQVCAL
jgi:hypothetical protein